MTIASSFDPKYGCRDGTPYEVLEVSTTTIGDLIERFGTPYFMKIDVEGADKNILSDLRRIGSIPDYISVEEYGVRAIDDPVRYWLPRVPRRCHKGPRLGQ